MIIIIMPPSSPPRHPREEEDPEPYSLIVMFVVVISNFSIKRPVTVDTAIDRSIFPAGVHLCYATRTDLQGGGNLVREHSTEAIRHFIAHLSNSTERSSAGLYPMYAGPWTLTPTYSCTVRGWPVKLKQIQIRHHRARKQDRSEEPTPELPSRLHLVCRL